MMIMNIHLNECMSQMMIKNKQIYYNINQYQNMKGNRSLKEISLNKLKVHAEKPANDLPYSYQTQPFNSPNISFQNMLHHLPLRKNASQYLKKITKSQQQLDLYSDKQDIKSYKKTAIQMKTQRPKALKEKNNIQNMPISPFQLESIHNNKSKYNSKNILTPINKNVTIFQQAKKPKILMKQRQSAVFSQQFRLGAILGKGRFGNVYRAQHIASKMIVAVKQISLQKICKKLMQRIIWEIKIQSFLRHPHCLQLYKCYKEGNSIYLVIENGDCSLFDKLREKKYFTQVETCYYITQTIKALIHMHDNNIIHRDIKPENIVLINNVVKLADFGWSAYISKKQKRTTFCGTLDYICPQIVLGNEYDSMVDVWSIGVLCYELCTGHAPFESSKSREDTYNKILKVDIKYPKYLSEDIKSFITSLLSEKPQNRMSLTDALNHKWIKKYFWQ